MFEVKVTSQAERAYKHLTPQVRKRVDRILEQLEQGNFQHRNIRPLTGPYAGSLRYRMGDWRLVFSVDPAPSLCGSKQSRLEAALLSLS